MTGWLPPALVPVRQASLTGHGGQAAGLGFGVGRQPRRDVEN